MKKTIATLGMILVSAAAFALPAAAHQREDQYVSRKEVVVVHDNKREPVRPVRVVNRYETYRNWR